MQQFDPENYERQLNLKLADLRADFAQFNIPDIALFRSPPRHFRMRAEFRIWQRDGQAHYAMHRPGGGGDIYTLSDFPIGSELMNQLMPPLLAAINANGILSAKLFAAEFLTTLSGEALVTLIYHRVLDDDWTQAATALAADLGIAIVGRSRGQKRVVGRDHVEELMNVAGRTYRYQQVEGAFTQPNATVNTQMLGWALAQTTGLGGDLLELYCGNGNFTLMLAQNFHRVLATEVAKRSVESALLNLATNNIANVEIVRMGSEELTQAINGVRPFRRLAHIDLASYRFSTVLVDPPRVGLDAGTLELVRGFDHILYISCNPATLKANLLALADTHRIARFSVFDQFPYTPHLECGVLLARRDYSRLTHSWRRASMGSSRAALRAGK